MNAGVRCTLFRSLRSNTRGTALTSLAYGEFRFGA